MVKIFFDFISQYTYSVYQPIISIKEKKIIGFEILTRLTYKNREYSAYEIFQSISDNAKSFIGKKNILTIAHMQKHEELKDFIYNINLSSYDMRNGASKFLKRMILSKRIDAKRIVVEITEDVQLNEETVERIGILKELGVRFAIDDFGNGYSTFNYLLNENLENIFDFIKLDGILIKSIESDFSKRNIAKTIIEVAHEKKIKVIAEHIDNFDNLEIMQSFNVDYIQGFLLAKPLKFEDKLRFIKQNDIETIVNYALLYAKENQC